MSEAGSVLFGRTSIHYTVVRSARRKKTIEITADGPGSVVVAAPLAATRDRIDALVRKRAGWIVRNQRNGHEAAGSKRFVSGETLPYLGRQVRMFIEPGGKAAVVRFSHWSFQVSVPRSVKGDERREAIRAGFIAWYRRRAEERLPLLVERWSRRLAVRTESTLIRDQRQRWASCGPDGVLRFNWRVMMLEPALIDYVVAHELCHRKHRTHTAAFWASLTRLMPDWRRRRRQLLQAGSLLPL